MEPSTDILTSSAGMTKEDDQIRRLVHAINLAEDDLAWSAWERDRFRLQEQIIDLRADLSKVAMKLAGTQEATGRSVIAGLALEAKRPGTWLTKQDVADYLGVSLRSLERMMADTPDHISKPWAKVGRTVRWHADQVAKWFKELSSWQALRNEERSGWSAGGTRSGSSTPGPARPRSLPRNSDSKSKSSKPTDGTGGRKLRMLAESLISKPS